MAVTVYLFDAQKELRAPIDGVSELIHGEHSYALNAAIPGHYGAQNGEYMGFMCVDGRFRLFNIDNTEEDDETGQTLIEATDAAVAELADKVTVDVRLEAATAEEAFTALLAGTGFELGAVTAMERVGKVDAYYVETWEAMQKARQTFNARLDAYYLFDGGRITGKRVDVTAKEAVFRGRIFSSGTDAGGVTIIKRGSPKTVLYPAGAATGTTSNPDRITIADAVWSKANGDPADKPAGQLWIEDEEASAAFGRRAGTFVDQNIQDPLELLETAWDDLQRRKQPTVTGAANAQDLEYEPGYSHMQVRLWDLVGVENSRFEKVMAQVIGIDRDYIHPWLTKFDLGDEKEDPLDIDKQMAKANQEIETLKRGGAGGSNKAEENKAFIVENMEQIRLHTVSIEEQGKKINQTEIRMQDAEVQIIATQQELSTLEGDVSTTTERMKTVEIELDAAKAELILKASVDELEVLQEDQEILRDEISSAEMRLNGLEGEIELKVSKNGVVNAINLSTEGILIDADKINLVGYVTASQLAALEASITNLSTGVTKAGLLNASELIADHASIPSLDVSALILNETRGYWRSLTMGGIVTQNVITPGNNIDLQHSHKVTVNNDGTITLGEVSSSGGSFNIADTAAYQEAVSAAEEVGYSSGYNNGYSVGHDAVTISQEAWSYGHKVINASNGKTLTVSLPEFTTSESAWSENKKTVYFKTDTETIAYRQIDAQEIYDNGHFYGYADGFAAALEGGEDLAWGEGFNAGFEIGYQECKDNIELSYDNETVYPIGPNTLRADVTIIASIDGQTIQSKNISFAKNYIN